MAESVGDEAVAGLGLLFGESHRDVALSDALHLVICRRGGMIAETTGETTGEMTEGTTEEMSGASAHAHRCAEIMR
jgi:hypothetical protein